MKIWQRHLFFTLLKTFTFFFLAIVFIFITVDLSIHSMKFFSKSNPMEIVHYYLHSLAISFELFASFAFFLASLRTLFVLAERRELLALQMAGLSKRTLLLPIFFFACIISLSCYINNEFFSLSAKESTLAFKEAYKNKKEKEGKVHHIALLDGSHLVYQKAEKDILKDVFFVESQDCIWHMNSLHLPTLQAKQVHQLQRTSQQLLQKTETLPEKIFSFDLSQVQIQDTAMENRPLLSLFFLPEVEARAHFYYKLLSPLTALLLLFPLSPIALRYSRNRPIFLIAAFSLFAFLSYKVLLDGFLILAENQALPPMLAIFSLPFFILLVSLPSFSKMR